LAAESVLRTIRLSADLTLEDVAQAASISVPGYYQIESGQRSAPANVANAIAARLGVPLDIIFMPVNFAVRKTGTV